MMGLFKKPNRKFRQRITRTDSEDESGNSESIEIKEKKIAKPDVNKEKSTAGLVPLPSFSNASVNSAKEKEDSTISKASKLLSFHDEEDDGEVFKLKKSNYSRRLAKQREREKKKKECVVTTKEANEIELTKGFKLVPLPIEVKSDLKFKDFQQEACNVDENIDSEDMDVESDEEKEKPNPFKNLLQSGVIPDAATIYAMKKHRQMAREMGDYIPVEDPEKDEEEKSRLVREEDHDRSDDDEDDEPSRLSFTVNTGAVERQKVREAFLSLQEGKEEELENEEAAELDLWEREQIRKGVSIAQAGSTQTPQISDSQLYGYPSSGLRELSSYGEGGRLQGNSKMPSHALNLPKSNGTGLTTNDVKSRLEDRLSSLKVVHVAHQQELKDCQKEFLDSSDLIKRLEEEGPEMARCFSLFQQMRGYVKDLVECLDLKVAHIELLDGRVLNLYKIRTQNFISRRQQDIRDQSDEFSMLSSEILKGVSAEFLSEKNICTDEARLRRAAEREGRRMRRRKQRERMRAIVKHHDGMSTDDEEPDIEILKFKESKEEILNEAATIFEDVVEEFGSLDGVVTNFEKWKYGHTDSYCEAYVPLCLPKIFGIFVRLSLLGWNPLEEKRDLEKTSWYRRLIFYGCKDPTQLEASEDDPDTNLLPGIVEKIILPKITSFIQNVWDPMSSKETLNLVSLVKQLHENYPTINGKSKQLQACFKAVSTRIYQCLDDDIFIPLYPKELLESRSLGAADFFQRQFWSSIKLLQNILSWDGIIAEQPLQDMSLAALLNRYILMGLHTSIMLRDTLDKCKVIVASLPKMWFKAKKNTTLPQLKPFSSYLLKFSDSYNSQCMKRGIPEEDIKDVVKETVQLLVAIESMDDAVLLAKKYSISAFKT